MTTRALAAVLAGLALAAPAAEPYGSLSVDEVEKLLGARGVAIYDANAPDLWSKHHLPGAVHIIGKDLRSLLPADRQTRLVFYCTNPK
jgi:rhodanese-related sulfurtransferase